MERTSALFSLATQSPLLAGDPSGYHCGQCCYSAVQRDLTGASSRRHSENSDRRWSWAITEWIQRQCTALSTRKWYCPLRSSRAACLFLRHKNIFLKHFYLLMCAHVPYIHVEARGQSPPFPLYCGGPRVQIQPWRKVS